VVLEGCGYIVHVFDHEVVFDDQVLVQHIAIETAFRQELS
jgi:hypothetical protein